MKSPKAWLVVFFICFACLITASCEEDDDSDDSPPSYNDYMEAGKFCLTESDAEGAAKNFELALAKNPESSEAKFGLVLAGPMRFFNFVDQIVGTIDALSFSSTVGPEPIINKIDSPTTDFPIQDFLTESVAYLFERSEQMYEELSKGGDFEFELDRYALTIADSDLIALSGTFGKTELEFVGALNALLDGAFRILLAIDWKFDYTVLQFELGGDGQADTLATINTIVELLDNLLSSHKFNTFLYLNGNVGIESMKTAGIDFGNAFARVVLMVDSLAGTNADDGLAPVGFNDNNDNGVYDVADDALTLGDGLVLEPDLVVALYVLCGKMSEVFYEGSPLDVNPGEKDVLALSDLDGLLLALGVLPIPITDDFSLDGLPAWFTLDIGPFFSDPQPDGLRNLLELLVDAWDLIYGLIGEEN